MAASRAKALVLLVAVLLVSSAHPSMGARRRMELYQPDPADMLSYHNGAVLHGDIFVSVLWYGSFKQAQKTIIYDFLLSLTMMPQTATPSVTQWWNIIDQQYLSKATPVNNAGGGGANRQTRVMLDNLVSDDGCSMGRSLTLAQIPALAARAKPRKKGGVALVFTAEDVTVEGFCMGRCGLHGSSSAQSGSGTTTYVWVGNSAAQCPGQCAWPFHQPPYGPQSPPLIPPNGDVGVDGMIINLATELAGAVTNPFRDAFYQGEKDAPLEAATACRGKFGSGAYPGYAGVLKIDESSRASYNAYGAQGRKYLLPALYSPSTSECSTLV